MTTHQSIPKELSLSKNSTIILDTLVDMQSLIRRAKAYVVNLPRPSSCYAGFLKDELSEENMPPVPGEVKGQGDISVEEWVL